ncbi:hypothetical protein Hte_003293 [Hypoxylon texense]
MAPLTPHWDQPSHPNIQEVIINEHEFTSKSLSKISLPPFGLYAKMDFPPCTSAHAPTYATVQCGRNEHLNLNKWSMAQPFDCLCGKPACRGRISGAKDMAKSQLEGLWLNGHIHELLEERDHREDAKPGNGSALAGGSLTKGGLSEDTTAQALKDALKHAEKVVEASRHALQSYLESAALATRNGGRYRTGNDYTVASKPAGPGGADASVVTGLTRRGATSRELSGEMGGDTSIATGS